MGFRIILNGGPGALEWRGSCAWVGSCKGESGGSRGGRCGGCRQRVQGKDLGLAIKASLSRNPEHLSPLALARRSSFFFRLCPQGPERDRDCLRGPAGLGVALEPGCLSQWPLPRHRELRVRLLAVSSLVSGLGGRWGAACAPQTLTACRGWAGAGAGFNEALRCSLKNPLLAS